jgi:hypothetical protein
MQALHSDSVLLGDIVLLESLEVSSVLDFQKSVLRQWNANSSNSSRTYLKYGNNSWTPF